MKTFSFMSTPDKLLTLKSYRRNLAFIKGMIMFSEVVHPARLDEMKKDSARLQVLIDTLEEELKNEE